MTGGRACASVTVSDSAVTGLKATVTDGGIRVIRVTVLAPGRDGLITECSPLAELEGRPRPARLSGQISESHISRRARARDNPSSESESAGGGRGRARPAAIPLPRQVTQSNPGLSHDL